MVVLSDGLVKKEGPGSLWEPAETSIGPNWSRLPLSFGLIMSGFSTHPIVPSIFKDMKNPAEFRKMLNWAYLAAAVIYLSMGLIGYIMFGNAVTDEITRDLARTKGYPKVLNKIALWLILINPLAKFALAARPIDTTLALIFGVEPSQVRDQPPPLFRATRSGKLKYLSVDGGDQNKTPVLSEAATEAGNAGQNGGIKEDDEDDASTPRLNASSSAFKLDAQANNRPQESPLAGSAISIRAAQRTARWSKSSRLALQIAIKVSLTLLIGCTAIVLPGFGSVMAFLGAFLACVTCIFGPLLANLRLLRHEMSRINIIIDVVILLIFVVVASLGTIWPFLPNM
jgi:vesicular inhibitory amino acid transporter